ncbi:MAG: hypothetical protein V3S54_03335, partial [Woeseiaceae bacterium]
RCYSRINESLGSPSIDERLSECADLVELLGSGSQDPAPLTLQENPWENGKLVGGGDHETTGERIPRQHGVKATSL